MQPSVTQQGPLAAYPADGYRGIWHGQIENNLPAGYRYKYSGGLGVYPQQHAPVGLYSEACHRTFFAFGAAAGEGEANNTLQLHVGCFDHATGTVCRPTVLLDRRHAQHGTDAHENPVLAMDADGHLLVFAPAHGPRFDHQNPDAHVFRSTRPHEIGSFEPIIGETPLQEDDTDGLTNFSYPAPWFLTDEDGEEGLVFLHVKYASWNARNISIIVARRDDAEPSGYAWSRRRTIANVQNGHYHTSWIKPDGRTIGYLFNVHPVPGINGNPPGLDSRTNLYYIETTGLSGEFRTVSGEPFALGADRVEQLAPALVHDYAAEGRLVYLKDVAFDADGNPVLVYLTSPQFHPGPIVEDVPGRVDTRPRTVHTAAWDPDADAWTIRDVGCVDHNYDYGVLRIEGEADGEESFWRLTFPMGVGPQPHGTGGEMRVLTSRDRGRSWRTEHRYAGLSGFNHTYARKILHGHRDFTTLWADGDPDGYSPSDLFFANADGSTVHRLPRAFPEGVDRLSPRRVYGQAAPAPSTPRRRSVSRSAVTA